MQPFQLRQQVRAPLLPTIENGTALLADPKLTRPDEIVAGLLHRNTKAVVAGPSKVGKTWLLLDLAVSVATGTPFIKWSTTAGRVLFVNFEIHRTFLKDRLQLVSDGKGVGTIDNLDIWNLRGKSADFDALINEMLKRIADTSYSLIILDPIYKAMVGRGENTASAVGKLCDTIEKVVEKTGAAVIYAHHFTKGNQSKKEPLRAMERTRQENIARKQAEEQQRLWVEQQTRKAQDPVMRERTKAVWQQINAIQDKVRDLA